LESKHEAAQAYVDAARCYKKTNINGMCVVILHTLGLGFLNN